MQTYMNPKVDRTQWGTGPWDTEPDKISWTDQATGMPCLIVRNRMGSLCGYVAVAPSHPYHGCDYDDVPVDVHGGLTFADRCHEDAPIEGAICHIPEPGKPGDVWWLGFDCCHWCDISPIDADYDLSRHSDASYKTAAYVRSECEQLAAQLNDLA